MSAATAVLVIDDNRALAENLQEILEEEDDIQVTVASDGESALGLLEQHAFDLVITDVRMPGLDGVQVLKAIQARRPTLPVIVMTAYSSDSLLEEAAAAGALGVLFKPLDMDHVIGLVRRVAEPNAPVLLLEDDRHLRINLAEMLLDVGGVIPHMAPDLATAERLIGEIPFRVAIVDVRLPDGDGLRYGQELRERLGDQLVLIFITGYASEIRAAISALLQGPQTHLLEKPFSPGALVSLIRSVV